MLLCIITTHNHGGLCNISCTFDIIAMIGTSDQSGWLAKACKILLLLYPEAGCLKHPESPAIWLWMFPANRWRLVTSATCLTYYKLTQASCSSCKLSLRIAMWSKSCMTAETILRLWCIKQGLKFATYLTFRWLCHRHESCCTQE